MSKFDSIILDGKVAVITGGHSGIGYYLTQALLSAGMKVAILARRADVLEKAASALEGEVVPVVCDVRNPESVREAFQEIDQRLGPIDVLINNAAVFTVYRIGDATDEEIQGTIETNVMGAMYCTREAIKSMRAGQRKGQIVSISSESVSDPFPYLTAYAVSKAAIETFMQGLKVELKKDGIRAGILRLGAVIVPGRMANLGGDPKRVKEFFAELMASQKLKDGITGIAPATVAASLLHMLQQPENASIDFLELRTR